MRTLRVKPSKFKQSTSIYLCFILVPFPKVMSGA